MAALLLYLVPGDATYIAVAGLFLSMKVGKIGMIVIIKAFLQVGPLFGVPVDMFSPVENKVEYHYYQNFNATLKSSQCQKYLVSGLVS